MKTSKIFVFLLALCGFTLLTSLSIPTNTSVPANTAWTKTDYTINIGDRLEVITLGEITLSLEMKCNPRGIENRSDLTNKFGILKTANFGCLIGKIGENGQPFVVGEKLSTISTTSGTIYLGINDSDLKDNQGEFTSYITVIKPIEADSTLKK